MLWQADYVQIENWISYAKLYLKFLKFYVCIVEFTLFKLNEAIPPLFIAICVRSQYK